MNAALNNPTVGLDARVRWKAADPVPALAPSVEREVAALGREAAANVARLTPAERDALAAALRWDVLSEFDARFYSAYVRTLDLPFSDVFMAVEREWAYDEHRHYAGFRRVRHELVGSDPPELAGRAPDFSGVAHLFADEFTMACVGAYDELVTVRAYRAQLDVYATLGPRLLAFTRSVVADEGRHYGGFLRVLRERHRHRLDEAPAVLDRVRATEGVAYGATFVLDHDDDVFAEWMYDEAHDVLLRKIAATR